MNRYPVNSKDTENGVYSRKGPYAQTLGFWESTSQRVRAAQQAPCIVLIREEGPTNEKCHPYRGIILSRTPLSSGRHRPLSLRNTVTLSSTALSYITEESKYVISDVSATSVDYPGMNQSGFASDAVPWFPKRSTINLSMVHRSVLTAEIRYHPPYFFVRNLTLQRITRRPFSLSDPLTPTNLP